ncbi:MAG: hypothetical protein HOB54_01935 [Flavobacteriales bacterium]|jgi:hypothetical protein|nr:hypothetical protein [Flavobacteriales bacterium]MBT6650109.1 hypothetical protein [Flavobacteriales bacterium]
MLQKSDVISELLSQLNNKLKFLNQNLESAIISRNSDTKSSAGDKFETSREMAQIEIRKLETEILKAQQFIQDLQENKADLIITETEVFLISIPFGKITINSKTIYCISNSAPISKLLLNTEISTGFNYRAVGYKVVSKS